MKGRVEMPSTMPLKYILHQSEPQAQLDRWTGQFLPGPKANRIYLKTQEDLACVSSFWAGARKLIRGTERNRKRFVALRADWQNLTVTVRLVSGRRATAMQAPNRHADSGLSGKPQQPRRPV
jgi:hypothetical protein